MITWPPVARLRSPWITALCFGRPVETESFLMPFQQMLLNPAFRLKGYLSEAGLSNKTLYSFRCGGAITMALTGSTLDDIVDHVG